MHIYERVLMSWHLQPALCLWTGLRLPTSLTPELAVRPPLLEADGVDARRQNSLRLGPCREGGAHVAVKAGTFLTARTP